MIKNVETNNWNRGAILFFILTFGILCFIMLKPYITFILLGFALAIASHPIYDKIESKLKNKKLSGFFAITIVLLIIIIPAILIGSALLRETVHFFSTVDLSSIDVINNKVLESTDGAVDLKVQTINAILGLKTALMNTGIGILGSVSNAIIGILMMFSIIYYCFIDGESWIKAIEKMMPLNSKHKALLSFRVSEVIKTVMYGEISISIAQGILGSLIFLALGIPNAIFWGFVIAVLSFLPFVGSGMVWIPAAIIKIMNGNTTHGVILVVYGFLVIGGIDYYLRPKIISGKTRIHPLTALLGAFGGLNFFGFPGLVLGPLIAAILEGLISFYKEDYYDNDKNKKIIKKR